MSAPPGLAADPVLRPAWRRARFWLLLGAFLVAGAALVALVAPNPGRPLDPGSPSKDGAKALAQVLRGYGVTVERGTAVADAARAGRDTAVLVVDPDSYSADQLARLARGPGRLVLLEPDRAALAAVLPAAAAGETASGEQSPACSSAGARAAGPVDVGAAATTYDAPGATARCYGGVLLVAGRVAVLGSSGLLRNDALARPGVAALDVNLLTVDRTVNRVTWLLTGTDASGPGAPTVWTLFPSGAHRAFGWLLLTGVVLVLWRARRLGPPVAEPLPVVVRAAEAVEGHGRLYRRARARDRAAAALRTGTSTRITRHLGLPRGAGPSEIAARLPAPAPGRTHDLLAGPPPADDAALLELAADLHRLERAAGVPPEGKERR